MYVTSGVCANEEAGRVRKTRKDDNNPINDDDNLDM